MAQLDYDEEAGVVERREEPGEKRRQRPTRRQELYNRRPRREDAGAAAGKQHGAPLGRGLGDVFFAAFAGVLDDLTRQLMRAGAKQGAHAAPPHLRLDELRDEVRAFLAEDTRGGTTRWREHRDPDVPLAAHPREHAHALAPSDGVLDVRRHQREHEAIEALAAG